MTAPPTQPKLAELQARHGAELGDRLLQLRKPAQEEIANAAYEEGYINALNILGTSLRALSEVMRQAGYGQCGGCEEWFPQLELNESEDAELLQQLADALAQAQMTGTDAELVNIKRCEECALAEDGDWAAPPPPEPTTPEEIAAAEEKKRKARDAVIAQEERAARRAEILASIPDPAPGTKPD